VSNKLVASISSTMKAQILNFGIYLLSDTIPDLAISQALTGMSLIYDVRVRF
jgi:hypothetical protein